MLLIFIGLLCFIGAFTNGFNLTPFIVGVICILLGAFTVNEDDLNDYWGCD